MVTGGGGEGGAGGGAGVVVVAAWSRGWCQYSVERGGDTSASYKGFGLLVQDGRDPIAVQDPNLSSSPDSDRADLPSGEFSHQGGKQKEPAFSKRQLPGKYSAPVYFNLTGCPAHWEGVWREKFGKCGSQSSSETWMMTTSTPPHPQAVLVSQ